LKKTGEPRQNMTDLSKFVDKLGEDLVNCKLNCEGIDKRVPPRCFFLENRNHKNRLDCIIVGQNPGLASEREKEEYRKHKTYTTIKNYAIEYFIGERPQPYYKRARRFAKELGWGESILWTELCKCQSGLETINGKKKKKQVPLQTFRNCIKNFLEKELKNFPGTPIIALGHEAFVAVSYRFPNRFVIGIPHPRGARGKKFLSLFKNDKLQRKLKDKYKKRIVEAKRDECIRIFPES